MPGILPLMKPAANLTRAMRALWLYRLRCVNAQTKMPFSCNLAPCTGGLSSACFTSGTNHRKRFAINITLHLIPIVSLIAGILILIMPRLLSTIVAIYLIMVGLVGLFGTGNLLR